MKKLIAVVLFTLMMSVAPVWAENGAYEFLDRAVAYYVSKIPYSFSDAEDAMSLSFARTFNFLYALNEGAFDLLFTRRSNFIP